MNKLNLSDVIDYVEQNIGIFHEKRIHTIESLNLSKILKKKNPYLFKAKNVLTAEQIIRGILDAYISSGEETIFGDWLEGLAIFINHKVYGGYKSGITGIDLEFDKNSVRYIINIKSGPNWGNAAQINKMRSDFKSAQKTLRTSNSKLTIVSINGCCYGKDKNPDKGDYFKYCGQLFWEFISGNQYLYTEIIEPLGYLAKEKNDAFINSYSQIINKITRDFSINFCKENGEIDWIALVKFNSAK